MSKKRSLSGHSRKTIEEVFSDFVVSQTAQGLFYTNSLLVILYSSLKYHYIFRCRSIHSKA